jgi:hypothetical protein
MARCEKSRKCFAVDCVDKAQQIFQLGDRVHKQLAAMAKIVS